jgi:pre-60S factor REI1
MDMDGEAESSDWETASDEDIAVDESEGGTWEEWDVCRSLFDNHISATMEDNLEYMWKHFGFYLPDAEALTDPEGLLRYLVRCGTVLLQLLASLAVIRLVK